MDDSLLKSNGKNDNLSLKLSKDTNNHDWLISRSHADQSIENKGELKEVLRKVPKKKFSLKVSVPICACPKSPFLQNNSEFRTQTNNQTNQTAHRLPPLSPQPTRLPGPSSPSFRMFRHPVPTSKGRTTLADKCYQIVKSPKPIPPKTTFQSAISIPLLSGDVPPATKEPAKDSEKNKTEESIIVNKLKTSADTCLQISHSLESPLAIKPKLPFSVVLQEGSYSKKTMNPINKENSTLTTAEELTQTENSLTVTEEEMHILEMVRNSSLTREELEDHLENCKKEKEKKNDNGLVIDLENDYEEDENDMFAKIMKHSTNNKSALNKIVKLLQKNKDLLSQPSTPPPETPSDFPSASSAEQRIPFAAAGAAAGTQKPPFNLQNVELSDIQKAFVVSAMLVQMGYRIVRIEPQTQGTQTEDHSNNRKRRLNSRADRNLTNTELINPCEQNVIRPPVVPMRTSQEVPVQVLQMQEIPVFQPPNPPRQPQQRQQYVVPEHIERQAQLYPNMSAVMPHQRAQNTPTRNHHMNTATAVAAHHPFEYNQNNTTFSTQQTQVQMPTPAQLYPNDPRRQGFTQVPISGQPHLSRVLGTHEANMHSQAQQGWTYAHYYDRQGNVYSQRHQ